jgi:hypothetical protein
MAEKEKEVVGAVVGGGEVQNALLPPAPQNLDPNRGNIPFPEAVEMADAAPPHPPSTT